MLHVSLKSAVHKADYTQMQQSRNIREHSELVRMGKCLTEETELEIEFLNCNKFLNSSLQQGGVGDPDTEYKKRKATLVLQKLVIFWRINNSFMLFVL